MSVQENPQASDSPDAPVGPAWVQRLLAEGSAPDPRFTLANERTFLAWVRTALAMIACGVGLEALAPVALAGPLRHVLAFSLTAAGAVLAVTAFRRWLRTERALRRAQTLPPPALAPVIAYGIAAAAIVLLVAVVIIR